MYTICITDTYIHSAISVSRILHALHSEGNEPRQFQGLTEMCNIMAMSPDESGILFNPDLFVPPIVNILNKESNPNLMLLAVRTLTMYMEVVPACVPIVVGYGAITLLCVRLMNIDYIDLAEQSLCALEKISIEHPHAALRNRGMTACLSYIDFFPINVQRTAATTAANMCRQVPAEMFSIIHEAIPLITNLLASSDSKILESACLSFARLSESYIENESKLVQIATPTIIATFFGLISSPVNYNSVLTPVAHSYATHFLAVCAHASPTLSIHFMKNGIISMLKAVLVSALGPSASLLKSNDTIFELFTLCHELLPAIPTPHNNPLAAFQRQISKILGRRRNRRGSNDALEATPDRETAARLRLLDQNPDLLLQFGEMIIPVVLSTFESDVSSPIRLKAVAIMNRLFYHANVQVIEGVIRKVPVSSFFTTLLTSKDWPIVVVTLQILEVLLRKLPGIFGLQFAREGVLHEIEVLCCAQPENPTSDDSDDTSGSRRRSSGGNRSQRRQGNDQEGSNGPRSKSSGKFTEFRNWAIEKAKSIKEMYFGIANVEISNALQEAEAIASNLSSLCKALRECTDKPANHDVEAVLAKILSPTLGITSFELHKCGFFDSFLRFLTYTQGDTMDDLSTLFNRVKRLLTWFLAADDVSRELKTNATGNRSQSFAWLISKMQDVLSKSESFPAQTQDYFGRNIGLRSLTQPFKIKLTKAEGEHGLKDYALGMINVEPLATVQAVEDFIWSKVRPDNQSLQAFSPSIRQNTIQRESIAARQRRRDRQDSSGGAGSGVQGSDEDEYHPESRLHLREEDDVVQDVSIDGPRTPGSLSSPTSPMRKRINQRKLTLYYLIPIDDERVALFPLTGYQSSVFHSIQQIYRSAGDIIPAMLREERTTASRLWGEVHTIVYRMSTETDEDSPSPSRLFRSTQKLEETIVEKDLQSWAQKLYLGILRESEASSRIFDDQVQRVLVILSILHFLNQNWDKLLGAESFYRYGPGALVQVREFQNQTLATKMNRQLQDPLLVCGGTVSDWCKTICQQFGFLIPFSSRQNYFLTTSLGVSRGLQRLQQKMQESGQPERHEFKVGRLARQKVRISRDLILPSAVRVLNLYASSKSVLEVEYFDEIGTGLGPTLEFYTLTSRELQRRDLKLWIEFGFQGDGPYVKTSKGLYPKPYAPNENIDGVLQYFKCLGQLVAKALLDGRILDIGLAEPFYKMLVGKPLSIYDVESIDEDLFRNLTQIDEFCNQLKTIQQSQTMGRVEKQRMISKLQLYGAPVESLELDFTFPGLQDLDMKPNGSSYDVTTTNIAEYLHCIVNMLFGDGVSRQIDAFEAGFNCVFPIEHLKAFTPTELDTLVNGAMEQWDMATLIECTKCDHGFTHDSKTVQYLLEVMMEMTAEEQREFILFITGSPKLPVGGLAALHPHLTIVRKAPPDGYGPDHVLPSVSTCFYYLKLPEYTTKEVLREKLYLSMREGQGNFLLS
eukprot:TRINITY_DN9833_c0_g2_i9.p1 TRINITY_DN9833_c0_g2~~TRINITY_DN9833_c0_g2_i9.p1  ORF type:complete len:1473 (+),score=252.80 TRINITY_DN9833_c0_g2_i9:299-4717(+)